MRIIKHEWHQVDSQHAMEINREDLDVIYPDLNSEEQDEIWQNILENNYDFQELIEAASDAGAWHIDWEPTYDDWWTHRKGGYEVTYDVEPDYVKPIEEYSDKQRIEMLEKEIMSLKLEMLKAAFENELTKHQD